MSIRHVAAVLDHYPHGDKRKLVLLALADQADERTWVCWPAIDRIARRACIAERQTQRTIAELEAEGVIEVIRSVGRGNTNRYRIRFDRLKEMPSLVDVDRAGQLDDGFEPIEPDEKRCQDDTFSCSTELSTESAKRCHLGPQKVSSGATKGVIAMTPESSRTISNPRESAREDDSSDEDQGPLGRVVQIGSWPPCMDTPLELVDPPYTGTCRGFITSSVESKFGTLLSASDVAQIAAAVSDGCLPDCSGGHAFACAAQIVHKLRSKGGPDLRRSRVWLMAVREDRHEVRRGSP